MNDRAFAISELQKRILQLEDALKSHPPEMAMEAIQEYIVKLEERLHEIEYEPSPDERLAN